MGFWVFFSEDKVEYYDSDACELYLSPARTVAIVANSKTILDYLIENRNIAISRSQITTRIDGSDCRDSAASRYPDRSVDQAIRVLRKKLDKYGVYVTTVHGVGYKYVGPPKVDKEEAEIGPVLPAAPGTQDRPAAARPDKNRDTRKNLVSLASILIHEGDRDHPEIKPELELEIGNIIDVLEQGLSEDFEEICEQAWENLSLLQKSLKIFRAYENLVELSREPSPDDPRSRR